jgi:hypothetical protein
MKLLFLSLVTTCVALANPITVNGSGTFTTSYPSDNSWTVSFSGIDEVNVVAGSFQGISGSPLSGFLSGSNIFSQGVTLIDGLAFGPGFATFSIGGEAGNMTGYDAQHHVVISQDLRSFITITAETCTGSNPILQQCFGTFGVHAPEPGTSTAVVLGAAILLLVRLRQKKFRARIT